MTRKNWLVKTDGSFSLDQIMTMFNEMQCHVDPNQLDEKGRVFAVTGPQDLDQQVFLEGITVSVDNA